MPAIYFDESGNTGPDYMSAAQPVFSLASVTFDDGEGEGMLQSHFGDLLSKGVVDLKYGKLSKTDVGRKAILGFLEEIARRPDKQKAFLVHKKFALVSKFIEWLIEPIRFAQGFDLHIDGRALHLANYLWFFAPQAYGKDVWYEMLGIFQRWSTGGGVDDAAFRSHVLGMRPVKSIGQLDDIVKFAFQPEHKLECPSGPDYKMDVSLASAYAVVRCWMEDGVEDIDIVHDASKVMEAQRHRWSELTDPHLNAKLFSGHQGEWPTLNVSSVRFGSHVSDPLLQLADVLAGAQRDAMNHALRVTTEQFPGTLRSQLKLPMPYAGGIFPDPDFVKRAPS